MLQWCAGASTVVPALPPAPRAARSRLLVRPCKCSAKKPANNEEQAGGGVLSKSVLLRSGVALFALGFVDAGYSGDWSRIGAIPKDTEELLKLGAYVVVPLSLALIVPVSEDSNKS
ncbi:hypothetical protein PR202_ga26639 [Eleusine coracana subsp. coracana]|uniref:DUF7887 domain-containing protein n=1 Tax=Eleusine coracana subsp. coracana TaxID=191504 RepID=A0AAV5DEC2_ELECO|nr:hypothetical protein QOZ80_3AG0238410 [Eleusine coracana subsp. coracana]GJN08689.1 hypothetical protein PR202_ga26639 [Eleusine coracana subsp. coracana]